MFQVSQFKFYKEKGFTIIEIIITIAILAFGILGIYSFFQPIIILNSNFSNYLIANYLTQEGMEVVKNIKDNNIILEYDWTKGFDICELGCELDYKTGTDAANPENLLRTYQNTFLNMNSDGFYSYDFGSQTIFKRKVTINQPMMSQDILKVDVLVSWSHEGKLFNSNVIGYIYNK